MLSIRVTATISSSSTLFFTNSKKISNKFSYISNPLKNSSKPIKWNCKNSRMESSKSSFVTKASAQPLTNPAELIDSVETFIFDCDGMILDFFWFGSLCIWLIMLVLGVTGSFLDVWVSFLCRSYVNLFCVVLCVLFSVLVEFFVCLLEDVVKGVSFSVCVYCCLDSSKMSMCEYMLLSSVFLENLNNIGSLTCFIWYRQLEITGFC